MHPKYVFKETQTKNLFKEMQATIIFIKHTTEQGNGMSNQDFLGYSQVRQVLAGQVHTYISTWLRGQNISVI